MSQNSQRVHRFVSNDFTVRAASVDATEVVREMQRLQDTYPLPTVAVGRAMIGCLLMASQLKEGQQVGVYVRGMGPMSATFAEAAFDGQVRGYTPHAHYAPESYGSTLSLKEAIGQGTMIVTRHQPFQKQPFQGMVQLVSGEIGDDIAYYLEQSQQIRSIVLLGVSLDTYGKVRAAGGLLVEVMPGVEEAVVDKIQKNFDQAAKNISQMLQDGQSAVSLVAPFLVGIPYTELDHDYPISYSCPCDKVRVIRALEILGVEELQDMINKKEEADITCQVCGRPYTISVEEIENVKNQLYRNSLN